MDRITMDARGQKWGQLQNPRNLLEHTVPNCITARLNKVNEERLLPEVMQQARKTFTKKYIFASNICYIAQFWTWIGKFSSILKNEHPVIRLYGKKSQS